MLESLLSSVKKKEDLMNKKPKEKSERSPITMRVKKAKTHKNLKRRRRRGGIGIGSSEKVNYKY